MFPLTCFHSASNLMWGVDLNRASDLPRLLPTLLRSPKLSAPNPATMKKHILIYGICGGMLIVVLKLIEYRFLVLERSLEIYGGLVALLFAGVGIWLGLRFTKTKETV